MCCKCVHYEWMNLVCIEVGAWHFLHRWNSASTILITTHCLHCRFFHRPAGILSVRLEHLHGPETRLFAHGLRVHVPRRRGRRLRSHFPGSARALRVDHALSHECLPITPPDHRQQVLHRQGADQCAGRRADDVPHQCGGAERAVRRGTGTCCSMMKYFLTCCSERSLNLFLHY